MFDVRRFLMAGDPWIAQEPAENVQRIYGGKYALATLCQPRSILEIGVRAGYSAAAFLSACPGAAYHGLDSGCDGLHFLIHAREALKLRVDLFDSQRQTFDGRGYDFVHVDGDHSYGGALRDIETAWRVSSKWILVDDYREELVRKAVTTFLASKPARLFEMASFDTFRGDCLIRKRPVLAPR